MLRNSASSSSTMIFGAVSMTWSRSALRGVVAHEGFDLRQRHVAVFLRVDFVEVLRDHRHAGGCLIARELAVVRDVGLSEARLQHLHAAFDARRGAYGLRRGLRERGSGKKGEACGQ